MESKKVVVVGGSFAGLTAAYELKRKLGRRHEVTVIDRSDRFVFIPSLIWVPFGWRRPEQISFPLRPSLERKGIRFLQASASRIDPGRRVVEVEGGDPVPYDYLLLATGPSVDFSVAPGLGPHGGHTSSICTSPHAVEAGKEWREFLKNPGPVVVGATQGSACFGAAYEFVFNLEYALRREGVRERVPLTFVTAEPFAGHFGIGGMKWGREMTEWFFRHTKIDWITDAVIEKVSPGEIHLKEGGLHRAAGAEAGPEDMKGKAIPFKYAMIIPPFLGAEAVRKSGLGNERGFVEVDDYYRHREHPEIFAAGVSVAVAQPAPCSAGCAVPKTGYISEVMAKTAAGNIVASLEGRPLTPKPREDIDAKCVLDAGDQGILMYTDRVYAPKKRRWEVLLPGPWAHWIKVWFERYYLWKMRAGLV